MTAVYVTKRADAREVVAQWCDRERQAGRRLTGAERDVVEAVVALLFGGHYTGARLLWYSDVARRAGRGEAVVSRTMRRMRAAGVLDGRPEAADPANDWHRERAPYRLAVPAWCRSVRAWISKRGRDALDRLRGASPQVARPIRADRTARLVTDRDIAIDRPTAPPWVGITTADDWTLRHRQARTTAVGFGHG